MGRGRFWFNGWGVWGGDWAVADAEVVEVVCGGDAWGVAVSVADEGVERFVPVGGNGCFWKWGEVAGFANVAGDAT